MLKQVSGVSQPLIWGAPWEVRFLPPIPKPLYLTVQRG
uniref:Uncharacterized protein n=2 Tax=unclassified Kuttervirus TaxID=2770329 RepID=A0AAU8GKD7_9CAUD